MFTYAVLDIPVAFNPASVFLATLGQQLVGFLWYGVFFSSLYCYYYAVDKGVKRAEYAIRRYSISWQIFSSLAANFVRAVLVAGILSVVGKSDGELCLYLEAGATVAAAALTTLAAEFWADRPLPLLVVNAGNSVVMALTAATVLFYTREINWFVAATSSADL